MADVVYGLPPGPANTWMTETVINGAVAAMLRHAGRDTVDPRPWAEPPEVRAAEDLEKQFRPEDATQAEVIGNKFSEVIKVQAEVKVEVTAEEGMLTRNRYDDWSPTGAKWVELVIPTTLSLWQLHRVVIQAMTAYHSCGGTLHGWSCNTAVDPASKVHFSHREDSLELVKSLASDGAVATQYGCLESFHFLRCCEHWVSACAVLFHPGASIRLEDGFTRYGQDYLLTLETVTYVETLAQAADTSRNLGLPIVLKGKGFDGDDDWSVQRANKQLRTDRSALRRDLSFDAFSETSLVLPWCRFRPFFGRKAFRDSSTVAPVPLSLRTTGGDEKPMALCREPPLCGDEFVWNFMDDPACHTEIADEYPVGECGELHAHSYD